MKTLFPPIKPYNTGFLQVDAEHSIYYEESGNPKGKPVVFLHGGPGSGCSDYHRTFFDPEAYRIVLFDQRGAGKSQPFASLSNNTTWTLVEDIEQLRSKLKIDSWIVFGGSWGSTLALCYAITHPERARALILRGIFLLRPQEIKWFYQHGAHHIYPDEFERYVSVIPEAERHDLVRAFYKRLTSDDAKVQLEAAKAWSRWEGATLSLLQKADKIEEFAADKHATALARIECHYFMNNGFMKSTNWILENVPRIRKIPGVIVHGRYDVVCAVENAWDLHKAWPEAKLEIIKDAGHAAYEPGIVDALVRATEQFKAL
jgi:proline iminopeptidase